MLLQRVIVFSRRDNEHGVIAHMNLILDKNEAKGRSLKPVDTGLEAEKALREALVTGKVGALSVDPQYLIVRVPRGEHNISQTVHIRETLIL